VAQPIAPAPSRRLLLILGGGPVRCEIAQTLSRFGARVTIVQKAPCLIPGEEPTVAETLADILREDAIDLRLSRTAVRAELHAERAWWISRS
jgi:pyruvate/2-oxoglutarate dehydrogenase complex dihydrolipoamide dehydrogenase (E3) component